MVPKRGTGANLLVPVALSASAVAYSSTRIENMFMSVGSAAGVAAKQLVDGDVATVQDVDVAKVQVILNATFGQRIHGPTGHTPIPPSPPAPKYYTVSGAGSKGWDGRYTPSANSYGGYTLATDPSHALYQYDGTWRLAIPGKELFYEATEKTGYEPPLAGWQTLNGTQPAPTLAAGPM